MKRIIGIVAGIAVLAVGGIVWVADEAADNQVALTADPPADEEAAQASYRPPTPERDPSPTAAMDAAPVPKADLGRSDPATVELAERASPEEAERTARVEDVQRDSTSDPSDLQDEIDAADALPGEGRFLNGGHLDLVSGLALLESEVFGDAIEVMAGDASRDADAQSLTAIYRDYVARILADRGGFVLDRIVCGLRLCIGQALPVIEGASWSEYGFNSLGPDGPPMYAMASDFFVTPQGRTFYRFMFTIDPSSPGIALPGP